MGVSQAAGDHYALLHVIPAAHPDVIRAAYRALARLLHPDIAGDRHEKRMVQLNAAYAVLRDTDARQAYDRERARAAAAEAAGPSRMARHAPTDAGQGSTLRHGRYMGWSLDRLARHDPDYLRWLSRQMSGRQYRSEIDRLLAGKAATAGFAR